LWYYNQENGEGLVPAHLFVMPTGQVQPEVSQKLRPALNQTTPCRPGHHLDIGLGAEGKDRCPRKCQLVRADPGLGRCLVLPLPGSERVDQDVCDSPRRPLALASLGQDGFGALAPEVTPDHERDGEALHNKKREMHTIVMYMQGKGDSSESLKSLPQGIHAPGAGQRTPRLRAPTLREQVLADNARAGPCVYHGGHRTGSTAQKLKVVWTLK